jgi:DNA-binding NarL/FixJ family response regulator
MGTLRILIADDHQSVRMLLRNILESVPEWEVCGEVADGAAAVRSAGKLHPDVIVMDLVMPERNGFEATREVLQSEPHARVVLTTLHEIAGFAEKAQRVGACGCFFKAESGRQLIPAVRAAASLKPFFTSRDLEARPS